MKIVDFHDKTWIEIPVEQNPAFDWKEIVDPVRRGKHKPTMSRNNDALVISKAADDLDFFIVNFVPIEGKVETIGAFKNMTYVMIFCNAFILQHEK